MARTRTGARRRLRLAAALLCSALLTTAGCSGGGGGKAAATPPDDYGCLTPQQASAGSITVDSDGNPLDAYVQGSGKVGIVFSHQAGGSLCDWLDYLDGFTGHGYRVLAYDAGAGGAPDVLAAAHELVRRGSTKVVLAGASMGAAASLAAAADPGQVKVAAVVSLSSPLNYQDSDALAAAKKLTVPAFFAAMSGDDPFPEQARELHRSDPDQDKVLKIYDGVGHGTALLRTQQGLSDMTDFVSRYAPATG